MLRCFQCDFLCFSFSLLWGPVHHMKHLLSGPRLLFTITYFGMLFPILYLQFIVVCLSMLRCFQCDFLCFSFSLLWGPVHHMKYLLSGPRLLFTIAYFGMLFPILYLQFIVVCLSMLRCFQCDFLCFSFSLLWGPVHHMKYLLSGPRLLFTITYFGMLFPILYLQFIVVCLSMLRCFQCDFLCFSFSLLWGPVHHMKHLLSGPRLLFTITYFGMLFPILYLQFIVVCLSMLRCFQCDFLCFSFSLLWGPVHHMKYLLSGPRLLFTVAYFGMLFVNVIVVCSSMLPCF